VSSNGNLLLYDKDVWTRYDTPDIPINNSQILDLLETTDGTLWVIGRERVDRLGMSRILCKRPFTPMVVSRDHRT
jgi:hypothetical protein